MRRRRLCGQHAFGRVSIDKRIGIEMGRDDVRPFIEDSMQRIIILDIEDRDCTPPGACINVPAEAARLVCGNPGPERLSVADQIGRPLRPGVETTRNSMIASSRSVLGY
jgi:hypothetical protein